MNRFPRNRSLGLLLTLWIAPAYADTPMPGNVTQLLQSRCFQCHGMNGQNMGNVGSILDADNLIRKGVIIPSKPDLSPLIRLVRSGDMPTGGVPRLTDPEIKILSSWIESLPPVVSTPPSGTPSPAPTGNVPVPTLPPTTQVLQRHGSPDRSGMYVEPSFTRDAVKTLGKVPSFSASVDGEVNAQPVYVRKGAGNQDVLIVATQKNQVYGFDAVTGAKIWSQSLGTPANRGDLPCGNIRPLGVLGSPVVDEASNTVIFDTMVVRNTEESEPTHLLHRLSVATGVEQPGWPIDVSEALNGIGQEFLSKYQNQRGALAILNGTVYVPYGAHWGDCGNYHGWVVGINLSNPSQVTAWKTTQQRGGVWSPGGVTTDGSHIYFTTANARGQSTWAGAEAMLKLEPSLRFGGTNAEFFAPLDWGALGSADSGLGSVAPMIINAPGVTPSTLLVTLGKDGFVYVVDRTKMGGVSKPLVGREISTSIIISVPTFYTTSTGTYIVFKGKGTECPRGQSGDLTALKINPTHPISVSTAWCADQNGTGSPIVTTTDGHSNAMVWGMGAEGDSKLRAFDAETGAVIFDGTNTNVSGMQRFLSPIVASGRMYTVGGGKVVAFAINGGAGPLASAKKASKRKPAAR